MLFYKDSKNTNHLSILYQLKQISNLRFIFFSEKSHLSVRWDKISSIYLFYLCLFALMWELKLSIQNLENLSLSKTFFSSFFWYQKKSLKNCQRTCLQKHWLTLLKKMWTIKWSLSKNGILWFRYKQGKWSIMKFMSFSFTRENWF